MLFRSLNAVTDPFSVTNAKLDGWYPNITGGWGEWATIEQYYAQGKLADFSNPIPGGEVDLKINEGGIEKWMEVKNAESLKNAWKDAVNQAEKFANQGAKEVEMEFLQQDASSGPSVQQMKMLTDLQRRFPAVKFEIKYGPPDPGSPIPFDPPSNNWGRCLP